MKIFPVGIPILILPIIGFYAISTNGSFAEESNSKPTTKRNVECFIENVLRGDALRNINPGEVKRLRVVAVEPNPEDRKTPISLGGTKNPLRVLGEVPIEEDGSAWFEVPAETPIVFQLLNERGWTIQTMRKPITLRESASCMGCHSDGPCKPSESRAPNRQALVKNKTPHKPKPLVDSKIPFRYPKFVQPIWDKHCISCHTGDYVPDGPSEPLVSFLSGPLRHRSSKQMFTESYLTLIDRDEMPLVDWIVPDSEPAIKRPFSFGSVRSELMIHLEHEHYEVDLTDHEKRVVACWIDLGIPFD